MEIQVLLQLFLKSRIVCTDTRKIEKGCLFFALKGENFNGNTFAQQAIENGAAYAIIDESEYKTQDDKSILVDDVLQTLQQLARAYRDTFQFPVLGITGSNGKTTTKELVRDVLAQRYNVHATHGNLNNHIGVPLTLLGIREDCNFAVVEMGANHQQEIAALCEIAAPNFGTITNIGKAHLEGFGGIAGVKKGKKELFDFLKKHNGKIFVNETDPVLLEIASGGEQERYGQLPNITVEVESEDPYLHFTYRKENYSSPTIKSQMTGRYNLMNMATAIAIGEYFDVASEAICTALEAYQPDNNRSEIAQTTRNQVIKDYYNANPTSTAHALENLARLSAAKKFFVIGDMLELGTESETEHKDILSLATKLNLAGITVGEAYGKISHEFARFPNFGNNTLAQEYLEKQQLSEYIVLVKGSRGIALEKVLPAL